MIFILANVFKFSMISYSLNLMKKQFSLNLRVLLLSILMMGSVFSLLPAQAHGGEYMDNLNGQYEPIKKDTWAYMVAVANNRAARKIDKRRTELITSINTARAAIARLKPWDGDASLRDSAVSFLKLSYYILNEDYARIIDLEEVAEQSYDAMEAYIMAQEKASEKYNEASARLYQAGTDFAARHNVTLIKPAEDKLSAKIEDADTVLKYYHRVFLIMFKSQIMENNLIAALNENNISAAEQSKNKLAQNAADGLIAMGKVPSFNGDASLKTATQQLLTFYKTEAETKIPVLIDFHLKKENFEKMKTAIEGKPKSQVTKEDTDAYNKAVEEYNTAVNKFNATNTELNASRTKFIDGWNAAGAAFTSKHVPNR
jgi:hypothetical protein